MYMSKIELLTLSFGAEDLHRVPGGRFVVAVRIVLANVGRSFAYRSEHSFILE